MGCCSREEPQPSSRPQEVVRSLRQRGGVGEPPVPAGPPREAAAGVSSGCLSGSWALLAGVAAEKSWGRSGLRHAGPGVRSCCCLFFLLPSQCGWLSGADRGSQQPRAWVKSWATACWSVWDLRSIPEPRGWVMDFPSWPDFSHVLSLMLGLTSTPCLRKGRGGGPEENQATVFNRRGKGYLTSSDCGHLCFPAAEVAVPRR